MSELSAAELKKDLAPYVGKIVVLDTKTQFLYVGTLESIGADALAMTDVDVHDCTESRTSRDLYILQTREHGVRRNRRQSTVLAREVVSVSLLDDVVVY